VSEKPPWRKAIEDYERTIGAPLEEFIKSDEFADMAAEAAKKQTQIQRDLGSSTTQWLHSMNLPAASDIAELREEVQALREEVRALTETVAAQRGKPAAKAKPKPKPSGPKAA
jgi:hypothetical protein